MTIKISASLLSADYKILESEVRNLVSASADYIHFDVMDGVFVPEITFGAGLVKSLRPVTKAVFDVHLMVQNPERLIESFVYAGADIITVHIEATPHIDRLLSYIRSFGIRVGVSICPGTPESSLNYIYELVDLILVMSVNPGFGGQQFLHNQLAKISVIRNQINTSGAKTELGVDGGINLETAALAVGAGADVLVSGSYIFKGNNYVENIASLKACYKGV